MTTPAGDNGTGTETGQSAGDSGADPNASAQVPEGQENGDGSGDSGAEVKDWQKEAEKWKTLSRKHEGRAKENAAAATELAKLQDKDKTELQRATERAARAEAAEATERSERYRLLAAAHHDLGPDFVPFLGTGTEEEIFARAETLSKQIGDAVNDRLKAELAKYGIESNGQNGTAPSAAAAASLSLGRRPTESLRAGSAPASSGQPVNKNDAFRGMLGR